MKVESIRIKNFKAISEENLEISGNNVYVLGKNGVGKSSFLDAIFKVISGKDLPTKLTNKDAKNGFVEIDLGELLVRASFNEKNEKVSLTIENKDGAEYKSPRTMLDGLAGIVDFDINEFFRLTPKKQVDFIKGLVGLDFTDLDDEYKFAYDQRAYANKKVKELDAKQITFDKSKVKEIDIADLQNKISEVTAINNKIRDVKTRSEERAKKISELEVELAGLKELQAKASEYLALNKELDITEVSNQVNVAIEHNKEVENTKKALALRDELLEAEVEQKKWGSKLAEIESAKKRIISESKMPVPGLTFDEDQIYYNGLPFEKAQLNTAQQIIVGLQINLALLKDIKIARFDGSLLDNDNIKIVEEWAKENDLQLFVELVDRNTETLKIEIKEESNQLITA
jgi:predicted ATP-dependent endonuclease of OLD family